MPHFKPYGPSKSMTLTKRRAMYAEAWRALGTLYGPDYEQLEVGNIHQELEALGVPVGYGRVGKAPTVLGDEYCPKLPKRIRSL